MTARMNGLRVNAQAIPVPTPIRSVAAAIQVAWVTELRNSSGAQTHSIPACSASRACVDQVVGGGAERRDRDPVQGAHALAGRVVERTP